MQKQITPFGAWVKAERGRGKQVADALDVKPCQVSKWITGPVPIQRCAWVERITGIKAEQLNPTVTWHRPRKNGPPVFKPAQSPRRGVPRMASNGK